MAGFGLDCSAGALSCGVGRRGCSVGRGGGKGGDPIPVAVKTWQGKAITAAIMRNDQTLMRVTAQCVTSNPRKGFDMSGRRPLIKGYFATFALDHGCGHVFGLFDADHDAPRGDVVVRSSLARITLSRLTAQSMPRALRSNRFLHITSWSPSILSA